jgi:pSer/pThr/pTyr-binding forkhead associated (FHA) protein
MTQPGFTVDVDQNQYLPEGGRDVNAIITATSATDAQGLIATPDGGWAVLDSGSANGTLVNGSEITAGQRVPLRDGDRINIGAWTVIMMHRG